MCHENYLFRHVVCEHPFTALLILTTLNTDFDFFFPLNEDTENRLRHAKRAFEHAQCADLDHPAHAQSIIQSFAFHSYIL